MKPKRITANDISAGHPKNSHCSTDQYYANLATKFQNVLYKDEEIREFLDEIDPQFLRIISILLTLHAEDVITGAGIWRAFCLRHKELYGCFMPFGFDKEVAGDFDIESYNEHSFQLLTWIYVSDEDQDVIYNPNHRILRIIGLKAAIFFLEVLEDAPINDDLLEMLYGEETEKNLYRQRDMMMWIQQGCYLSRFNGTPGRIDLAMKSYDKVLADTPRLMDYTAIVNFVFTEKCGPLALLPKDWYSTMLKSYDERDLTAWGAKVGEIEYKQFGVYKIERYDDYFLYLKDTEGTAFAALRSSYGGDITESLSDCDEVAGAFIRYDGEWHVNGSTSWYNKNRESVFENVARQITQKKAQDEVTQAFYEDAVKKNGGRRLFYFRDMEEYAEWMRNEVGVRGVENMVAKFPKELRHAREFAVYINKSGADTGFVINSAPCFFDKNNPFYNEEIAIEETLEFLMCIDAIDGEFANYLIANGMLKDASFPGSDKEEAHSLAQDNLDFLCRNLRRGVYGQE